MYNNFIPPKNQENIISILVDTFKSYKNRKEDTLEEWVENELKKYPEFNEQEAKQYSKDIVKYSKLYTETRNKIAEKVEKGDKVEYATFNIIKKGVNFQDTNQFNNYIKNIDESLEKANELKLQTYITKNGNINQNPQLHGFVAEEHHVNSFNIEAAQQGSKYRAEMLQSNNKNSVDIVIKDTTTGKIVRKYSAKYGQNAEDTQKYFEKGDYRGQRKLVPTEQKDSIKNSTDTIESPDGIKSRPLSRTEAKKIQKEIQEKKKLDNYDWEKLEIHKIAKHTAKQTAKTIIFSALFNGVILSAKRAYEVVFKDKKYTKNDFQKDIKLWFDSTKDISKIIGIKTAINTGFIIIVRKGLIPVLSKTTPVNILTGMVHVGIENAKTMYKMAIGKIGFREGIKQMGITTSSTIAGLAIGSGGASIGGAIGAIFGPIGTMVGSFIGGVVGAMAGNGVIEKVIHTSDKIYNKAKEVIVNAYNSIKETTTATVKNISKAIDKTISAVSNTVNSVKNSVSNAISNAASWVKSLF